MHVLLITQYFPPEIGAAASRWSDYTKILNQQGHKVTVLCEVPNYPQGKYFHGYKSTWVKTEKINNNLTIIRSYANANNRRSIFKKLIHYLTFMVSGIFNVNKVKKYDFVIVSVPPLFTGMIGVFLKKYKSIPFWLDIRDLWPDSALALNQINKNFLYHLGKKIELLIYNSAEGFIFPVSGFKKYLNKQSISIKQKPKYHLLNGISADFISSIENIEIESDERFTVLYSGNIGLAQGLETIIEAAKLLDKYPIDFRLIGDGVCKNHLQDLIKKENLEKFFFHNSMSRLELIKWIKKASVCVVPLINNSLFRTALPSKMFEYMACQKPIIIGIKGEAENLVNNSKSGTVVEPENAILMSKAIIDYYQNKSKCIEHGTNGMIYVTENLKKEDLISKVIKSIQNL
tara:strand:- start:5112 stop:6317 length:1206 start_codon:yes stop_codon:yes gene_type:complete